MTITGQSALSKDDIDKMVRDAEAHADDDRRRREEAEIRNQAETLVYQTEKLLREQGDKIAGDEKDKVEAGLKNVKDALAGSDIDAVKNATESLMQSSQTFAQRLYDQASQQSAAAGSAEGGPGPAPDDDEVVDAEIVDEQGA